MITANEKYSVFARKTYASFDVPLSTLTGFRTGGPADLVLSPEDSSRLIEALSLLKAKGINFFVLGKGSNVLALDEGYRGAIIRTDRGFGNISVKDYTITAGAGVTLAKLCETARESCLSGLEFAYGIPGSVGGAVFMNAGAYDGEIKDVLSYVKCINSETGETCLISNSKCDFGYRHSRFTNHPEYIITEAVFNLVAGTQDDIRAKMDCFIGRRKDKQPLEYPSCGSTFKRPEGAYASALIDQCGLKGYSVGGAMVSEKHAGFVINYNNATSHDIFNIISDVQRIVKGKTGYELSPEVIFLK